MKGLLVTAITFIFCISLSAQKTASDFVYFDHDQFNISEKTEASLQDIVTKINAFSDFTLQIYGHTDQDGKASYNQWLAEERAEQVYHALVKMGIDESRMIQSSFGENQLVTLAETNKAKALNRRVEIKYTYQNFETTSDLLKNLSDNTSQISIEDGSKEINLELKLGSKIKIPANALVFSDGSPVTSPISIEVKEAFSMTDFAQNKLSCNSGEELLESGGMLFIAAKADGQELKIKDGSEIDIEYPVQKIEKDMELFYGQRDNSDRTNWAVANSDIEFTPEIESEIVVDLDQFLEYRIEPIEKPVLNVEPMEVFPKMPKRPHAPNKPRLIEKDKVYLSLTKVQKVLMPQEKKDELREEKYVVLVAEHENKMAKYEEKYARYLESLKTYVSQIEIIKNARLCWQEEAQSKYLKMLEYKHNISKYNKQKRAKDAQLFLERNINTKEPMAVFTNFHQALAYEPKKNLYRKLAKYIFGPNFEEVLRDLPNRFEGYREMKLAGVNRQFNTLISKTNRYYNQLYFMTKKELSSADLGKYTFSIAALGWINCDRFVELAERVNFALIAPRGTQFFMVFNDIRSVLSPKIEGERFVFQNIPADKKVSIIGMNIVDKKPMLFVKEVTTGPNMKLVPNFKRASLSDIRRFFEKFDS